MKKAVVLSLLVLLVLSVASLAFANPGSEFKPINAFFNDQNEFIVQGKFVNWEDDPVTVKDEVLRVTIWGSLGMTTYTVNVNNMNLELSPNSVTNYEFYTKIIPLQTVNQWSVNTNTHWKK